MKTIRLDITHIQTVKALHIYLAYRMDFPAHYGKNLDALHDLLGEVNEPVRIVLAGTAAGSEMERYLPRLERVLEDCAQENAALCYARE